MPRHVTHYTSPAYTQLSFEKFAGKTSTTMNSIIGDISAQEHHAMKAVLLDKLNQTHGASLRHRPSGFPFHYVRDGRADAFRLSYSSFEFKEDLSNHPSRPRPAHVVFTRPEDDKSSFGYLAWRIYFPLVDAHALRTVTPTHQSDRIAVAHVQVDPMLLSDQWFGRRFCEEPRLLLRALAMSLEYGRLVTISYKYKPGQTREPNPIVYLGTNNDGRQEILFVLDG
jgi:hypothetical protein